MHNRESFKWRLHERIKNYAKNFLEKKKKNLERGRRKNFNVEGEKIEIMTTTITTIN